MQTIQGRGLGMDEEQDPYMQLAAGILVRMLDDLAGRGPDATQRTRLDAWLFLRSGAGGLLDLFGLDPALVGEFLSEPG